VTDASDVAVDVVRSLFARQIGLSASRIAGLEADLAKARERCEQLVEENRVLRAELDKARRAGKRQAAPFSRGVKKPAPQRSGRKPGAAYGTKARRLPPPPGEIDEQRAAPLPACCPDCGGDVVFDGMGEQFQEEIVPARTVKRRYEVALGHCGGCDRKVHGAHPDQTSAALGAAGVTLGPVALALAAWLHTGLGVPMAKVAVILQRLGGLTVTPGGLHAALHRIAADGDATYRALIGALRASGSVAADETGWRIDGDRGWLWVYVGDQVTVFDIAAGRGYQQAAAILGDDFDGVIERDGWAPYRKFAHADHQTCIAHLLRRCRELTATSVAGQAKVPHELSRILHDALAVRDRGLAGDDLDAAVAALRARIEKFCARRPTHEPNRKLVAHVARERDHLLTFLTHPARPQATNWRAEQALRPMVVNRKHWGGNKTARGAHTTAVLGSILRTCHQQGLDAVAVLAQIQRDGAIPDGLTSHLGDQRIDVDIGDRATTAA
jgi:transposase